MRNESARQLRGGGSRTLAYVVLDTGNPFFTDVAQGVQEAADNARARGVPLQQRAGPRAPVGLPGPAGAAAGRRGADHAGGPGDPRLALLPRRGTPVVLVDRRTAPTTARSASTTSRGGELAATHLHDAGPPADRVRRRAAVPAAGRPTGSRACAAPTPPAVSTPATSWCWRRPRSTSPRDGGRARAWSGCPARSRPTAAFCANDLLALGLLQEAVRLGLRVPEDLAIVGYDDIEFAAAAAVPLTSVAPAAAPARAHRRGDADRGGARAGRRARAPAGGVDAGAGGARVESAPTTERGGLMKIALFVTCLADALFPDVGRATVTLLERLGHEVVVPRGADLLRADARQHRLPARGAAAGAPPRRGVRALRRGGRAVGVVRGVGAPPARDGRAGERATRRSPSGPRRWRRGRTSCRSCWWTCWGSRTSARTTRTGSPTTPPATRCACCGCGDKPLRLLRHVRGHDAGGAARGRPVLRVRRHVRAQERRHVHGDARRQDAPRAVHRRGGAHGRGRVLPDAHRRRPVPAALGHPHRAPGRDPGGVREPRDAFLPWRRHEHRPGDARARAARGRAPARRRSPSPTPPARRWPTPSCAATSATPPP